MLSRIPQIKRWFVYPITTLTVGSGATALGSATSLSQTSPACLLLSFDYWIKTVSSELKSTTLQPRAAIALSPDLLFAKRTTERTIC